ncbi:MAG TPA: efflux RND transporter permease subunit, partial [Flavisolibacter sp.]|nr:efflux RND transporter permease subunit [Flavisolibacter sp.]
KPELRISVDRMKASQLGISVQDISTTLNLALSNRRLGYFTKEGKQYQVIGQVERSDRDDPSDLKAIYVRNNQGNMIGLDNVVNFTEATTPSTIYHFNRFKSATISSGLAPGRTIGEGIEEMQRISDKLLDESFSTSLSGSSREYAESSSNIGFAFFLALGLIFLILAAQFESFVDPLIIMVTVPLALAGAVLTLWIFDQTLNIFSQIGMIMLIGIVTKNGILIVEFANQNRMKGMAKKDAAIYSATQRLRPILMTSLTIALGALPIALSFGAAATSRIPLGTVIVGGVLFSLILTLFVIPAMYSFLSSKKRKNEMEVFIETESKQLVH